MKSINRYQLIVFLVMPFLLSWPAWFNGQPFLFPDTTAYIKGAASAVNVVYKSDEAARWLQPAAAPAGGAGASAPAAAPAPDAAVEQFSSTPERQGVISGRSVYYGFFVFVITSLFGLSAVPLVQALVSTVLIASVLRARFSIDYKIIASALLLLAIASPLPFFDSLMMPDVFAGLGILAAVGLILIPSATPGTRVFWALLMLAALLFHTGNILILSATVVTLVVLSLLVDRGRPLKAGMVLVTLAMIALGIFGEAMFSYAVKYVTNSSPIRPPFMTARLLADGPGNDFVKSDCAQTDFEVCKYRRDFTRATSDDFLWSMDGRYGVFTLVPKASRQRLGQQDFAFAKAVFMKYPSAVIKNSARNIAAQIGYIGLEEYIYTPGMISNFSHKLPADEQRKLEASRAAHAHFDVAYYETIIKTTTLVALMLCLVAAVISYRNKQHADLTFIVILLLSELINAGVCGALSTPHDRYQARIIWIVQLLAFVVVALKLKFIKPVVIFSTSPKVGSTPAYAAPE